MRFFLPIKNFNSNAESKKLHKNLFIGGFENRRFSWSQSDDEHSDAEYTLDSDHNASPNDLDANTFRLNHLPILLAESIGESVCGISNDKFFFDDISFLLEIARKKAISPYAIVVALIYLKRLKTRSTRASFHYTFESFTFPSTKNFSSHHFTNTELCFISILLASKYLVDEGESEEIYNDEWAEAVELSTAEVNQLERDMLKQLDWNLHVSPDEFWNFADELTQKITRKKISFQLGECTYTDLDVLLRYSQKISCLGFNKDQIYYLFKIILVCSATIVYVALTSYLATSLLVNLRRHLIAKADISQVHRLNDTHKSDNGFNQTNSIFSPNFVPENVVSLSARLNLELDSIKNEQTSSLKRFEARTIKQQFINKSCYLNDNVYHGFQPKINKILRRNYEIQSLIENSFLRMDSNQKYIISLINRVKFSQPLDL